MAGFPLFAHADLKKKNCTAPLKVIKIPALTQKKSLFKVLKRRTGLVFASFAAPQQNRQKREESHILSAFYGFACVFFVSVKHQLTSPPN